MFVGEEDRTEEWYSLASVIWNDGLRMLGYSWCVCACVYVGGGEHRKK